MSSAPSPIRRATSAILNAFQWTIDNPLVYGFAGVAALFIISGFNQPFVIWNVNPPLWVVSNVLFFIGCVGIVLFTIIYGLFFKWNQTSPGRLIFAEHAVLAIVAILLFVGIFLNSTQPWYEYPANVDVLWWRPLLRTIGYAGFAIVTVIMNINLFQRLMRARPVQIEIDPNTGPRPYLPRRKR